MACLAQFIFREEDGEVEIFDTDTSAIDSVRPVPRTVEFHEAPRSVLGSKRRRKKIVSRAGGCYEQLNKC